MNKDYYLKKALLSKETIIVYISILIEMIILFVVQDNVGEKNLAAYMGLGGLFTSGILIAQYLLIICFYVRYLKGAYTLLRFVKLNNIYKRSIAGVFLITLIFIIMVNIFAVSVIKLRFGNVSIMNDFKYLLFMILVQFLSFMILGYIFLTVFFKNYDTKISFFITFFIYIIATTFFMKITSYLIIPINSTIGEIINMVKILISIHIVYWIYFINFKNKVIEFYGK